jgi:DNA polymerase I-like protein with 3'-5' exonuclease and polymerase domains
MHYAAFNTAVQSWAADIMKRITLRVQDLLRDVDDRIYIVALVHDSWVINCPKDMVEEWVPKIKECIEATESKMCVPLLVNYAISDKDWSKCK